MKLYRDVGVVTAALVQTDDQIICTAPCRIQVPARFIDVGLGQIGIDTFVLGCLPIILESGAYAVLNICALVELTPSRTITVTVGNTLYYEFQFEANSVVIKTRDLVRRNGIMYNIFDEFIFKGKVPWYMSYSDIGSIFDTAKSHGDSNIGETQETIEFIASMISRPISDRGSYIRTTATSYKDFDDITYVPLASVFYSVNSTLNKLAGSHFTQGVTSALVTKTENVDRLESILRA